jgi:hypothetical protein
MIINKKTLYQEMHSLMYLNRYKIDKVIKYYFHVKSNLNLYNKTTLNLYHN